MLKIRIPGFGDVEIKNVVLDYNGTIAKDGVVSLEIKDKIIEISNNGFNVFVLTADTNNNVMSELKGLPIEIKILESENEDTEKLEILKSIGLEYSVAIGNGRNDLMMLNSAKIGIGIMGAEGINGKILSSCDIIVSSISFALDLIIYPNRLKATLRV